MKRLASRRPGRRLAARLADGLAARPRPGWLRSDQRGAALVESLVASVLLGIAMVVLVGSFSTLAVAGRRAEQAAQAEAASRAQAARIKAAPYQAGGSYGSYLEAVPAGLSRTITVSWWDGVSSWSASQNGSGLERIAVIYSASGRTLTDLEFVKANR